MRHDTILVLVVAFYCAIILSYKMDLNSKEDEVAELKMQLAEVEHNEDVLLDILMETDYYE